MLRVTQPPRKVEFGQGRGDLAPLRSAGCGVTRIVDGVHFCQYPFNYSHEKMNGIGFDDRAR
jgi:hypothetical protein